MHKKIEIICGYSDLKPNFAEIGNDPFFVFENDSNFQTLRLFDQSGNIVNVNSWLECANYVNGGWTDNLSDFFNGEKYLFITICIFFTITLYLDFKKKIFDKF